MFAPAAGYGNVLTEATRAAAGLVGDIDTLSNEPIGSQNWWTAGMRTAAQLAGTSRLFMGEKGPYMGTQVPSPKFSLPSEAELLPSVATRETPYVKSYGGLPDYKYYGNAYEKAVAAGDHVLAKRVVGEAFKDDVHLPVYSLDHMPSDYVKYLTDKYGSLPDAQREYPFLMESPAPSTENILTRLQ